MSPENDTKLIATEAMCYHCFAMLVGELQEGLAKGGSGRPFRNSKTPTLPGFAEDLPAPDVECPLFVTWDKQQPKGVRFPGSFLGNSQQQQQIVYELRGCIGSLSPKPLMTAIGEYALTSALQDQRFHPIAAQEISLLRVAVSLLVQYEACDHCFDWEIGTHGILIRFWCKSAAREYSATYLPEVSQEQKWDQKAAVASLIRKAGYTGNIDEGLFKQVDCTRYQSSKLRMTFEEYLLLRNQLEQKLDAGTEPSSASSSVHPDTSREKAEVNVNREHKQRWNTCNNL